MARKQGSGVAAVPAPALRRAVNMADRSARSEQKWVYAFAAGHVDGRAHMTELLGGKGAKNAAPADGKPGEAQSDAVPKRKPEDKLKDSIKGLFK